eukprot:scaffold7381_cov310-Pinguiococcus_pyrenoidosus.AAC.20
MESDVSLAYAGAVRRRRKRARGPRRSRNGAHRRPQGSRRASQQGVLGTRPRYAEKHVEEHPLRSLIVLAIFQARGKPKDKLKPKGKALQASIKDEDKSAHERAGAAYWPISKAADDQPAPLRVLQALRLRGVDPSSKPEAAGGDQVSSPGLVSAALLHRENEENERGLLPRRASSAREISSDRARHPGAGWASGRASAGSDGGRDG